MRACCFVLTALAVCLFAGGAAFADEASIRQEMEALKSRVAVLEQKLADHEKCIEGQRQCINDQDKKIAAYESRLAEFDTALHREVGRPIPIAAGLEISAGATMIVQGTNNTNIAGQEKRDRTDVSYSADVTLAKDFKNIGGRAFLHLESGQGETLEDNLVLYSNVNRDADNENQVHLTEIWYEQALLDDKAVLTFGKLDPTVYFDNNEAANDETTQFLGRIFRNSPVIEFPDNGAGIRLACLPKEWLELSFGAFDGDADWEKIGDNIFATGQLTLKTEFGGKPGNYRFLGWYNNVNHIRWLDMTQTTEAAYGFGLSFDQKLNDVITAFCRYGWQDPGVFNPDLTTTDGRNYSLEQSWSAGLQVEGRPWGREKDVLAFAVGQVLASSDYRKSDTSLRAKTEGHLEAYYKIHFNDHLSISPDFQYIWNPFGKDVTADASGIFVGGMRAQVDF